jgi:tripartite-type tricarboxylate transporter receptor subunit TctC
MKTLTRSVALLALLLGLGAQQTAIAQSYPSKPVRVLIPSASGAPPDVIARALSQSLIVSMRQPFVVENRVGANGIIGMEAFIRAAPDGFTIMVTNGAPVSLNPYFYVKLPYEPLRDLAPIVNIGVIAASIVAHVSLGINSMHELIEMARARPDTIIWANWGSGSFPDLYRAWAQSTFGVKFRDVPYKTPDQAMNAVVAGEVHVLLNTPGLFAPHVKAGKLKALATIGPRRSPALPEAPSFSELGYDLDFRGWVGMFAPVGTPRDIVLRLNAEINRLVADPAFAGKYLAPASVEPRGGTPEEFAAFLKTDRETAARLTKLADVKPQ